MAVPPSWWCREPWWLNARSWWGRAVAAAGDSSGALAAAARSERSVAQYDKASLARGFVFAGYRADGLAPVTMMPMMTVPVVTMPMAVMPVAAPADLLRLHAIDLGLRDQCGLRGFRPRSHDLHRRGRRQRRGIGNADKRHSARSHSDCRFQNRAKLHPRFSLHGVSKDRELRRVQMNAR
jgi:hypothetical protein